MENGLRQEKSTGYTPSTKTESESVSAPVESTVEKKVSPVLENVRLKDESLTSTVEVSLSKLLAIQIMLGDFKALKTELPASRLTSSNGKIYWCIEFPGHLLDIKNGNLLVDGKPVDFKIPEEVGSE